MADENRNRSQPRSGETSKLEHDRNRSPNDSDQEAERERVESGHDDAVRGSERSESEEFEDIDPDSAFSDVDRDDTIDEP